METLHACLRSLELKLQVFVIRKKMFSRNVVEKTKHRFCVPHVWISKEKRSSKVFSQRTYSTSFPRVKQPDREADHSAPTSAKVKKTWVYTSTPAYFFMAWCLIRQAQGQLHLFYFTLHIQQSTTASRI
jgi:hypothetical protein